MKVIFVGVHNKPHLKPLDSSTRSGKTIDGIIEQLPGMKCIKTNLFDVDYMPSVDEAQKLLYDFFNRIEIEKNDVVVLLGGIVQNYLSQYLGGKVIRAAHPSLQFAKVKRVDYISQVATQINKYAATKSI
jgi:hypothetical protein